MILDDDDLLDLRPRAKPTDAQAVLDEEAQRRRPAPPTNKHLDAWRPDAPPSSCHLCSKTPRGTCNACGLPSCAEHTWAMFSLCTSCATPERMERWHQTPQPEDTNWLEGQR